MDERKRTIKQLEGQKKDIQTSGSLLLERLGEILLLRIEEQDGFAPPDEPQEPEISLSRGAPAQARAELPPEGTLAEAAEYRRLSKEIADSQSYISATEADMLRLKELEEDISKMEQQCSRQAQELTGCYVRLGELLLEEPVFDDMNESYKQQIETLVPKIRSLEDRLEKLEDKNGANVFTWIGKNAQGMVLRSFLGNSQESLRRIYGILGERFVLPDDKAVASEEIPGLVQKIEDLRRGTSRITGEITALKADCRKINNTFIPEGSPIKRIQDMEKHIAHVRGELKTVYRRVGKHAADGAAADQFASMLHEDGIRLLEEIRETGETLRSTERQIEKLKASLTIDDEKAEIEKLNKAITDHRQRIALSEEAIANFEKRITDANRHIEDLTLLL
ncbi:MAG: hypothetical protein LBD55_07830 [Treponema sp.]|jgi:chromosome segregation ATPase|nr:hypothetical protein [Treponema sp.]